MSLINQMLKDLEQRGAGTSDNAPAEAAININRQLNPAKATRTNQLLLVKMGCTIVLLLGGAYWWIQSAQALSNNANKAKGVAVSTNLNSSPQLVTHHNDLQVANNSTPDETPLFETELKYQVSTITSKPSDAVKAVAYVIPEAVVQKKAALVPLAEPVKATKATEATELTSQVSLINTTPSEKSTVVGHALPKLSIKTNVDTRTVITKQIRPDQQSDNYYRQALSNLQQGRIAEAQDNLKLALEAKPSNQEARQTLAGLLLDNKRNDEAREVLAAGLAIAPEQTDFRMTLARLQVEDNNRAGALNTLKQGLAYAKNNADYQGFLATLLQRAERHEEAINYYMASLAINSGSPNALIGLGISLQAIGKLENAKEAFIRAQTNTSLSPELSVFVDLQLKQINLSINNSNH
jgi:MSHA biogenesis protein MshN